MYFILCAQFLTFKTKKNQRSKIEYSEFPNKQAQRLCSVFSLKRVVTADKSRNYLCQYLKGNFLMKRNTYLCVPLFSKMIKLIESKVKSVSKCELLFSNSAGVGWQI